MPKTEQIVFQLKTSTFKVAPLPDFRQTASYFCSSIYNKYLYFITSETILYTITKFMISNKLQIKDHAAYQNNKYVSTKIQEEETNAQVQINTLLSNAYKAQVDLLHFDDERCIEKKATDV